EGTASEISISLDGAPISQHPGVSDYDEKTTTLRPGAQLRCKLSSSLDRPLPKTIRIEWRGEAAGPRVPGLEPGAAGSSPSAGMAWARARETPRKPLPDVMMWIRATGSVHWRGAGSLVADRLPPTVGARLPGRFLGGLDQRRSQLGGMLVVDQPGRIVRTRLI